MSALTIPQPAALLGKVRRVDEPKPRYRVEVRRVTSMGESPTRPPFEFADKASAEKQFEILRRLGGHAYTEAGGYRLVLIDTEGRR